MLCYNCMEEYDGTGFCPNCGFSQTNYETPTHHLIPGTVLNNRYLVGTAIGEGGFGITYVGYDQALQTKVAIKEFYMSGYVNRINTYSLEVTTGSKSYGELFKNNKEKFISEARVLAKFEDYSGIVKIRDFFEANNTAYIIMNFLSGETLKQNIRNNGVFTWQKTLNLFKPVITLLIDIHKSGIIHRDISPDNLMFSSENQIKLLDFGAAREVSEHDTKSLSVILKPGFAPSEQYTSKGQGPWTDVYALCATMYYCITGKVPQNSLERIGEDELLPLKVVVPSCNAAFSDIVSKGMSINRKNRYQNMSELLTALQSIDANNVQQADDETQFNKKWMEFKQGSKSFTQEHPKNIQKKSKANENLYENDDLYNANYDPNTVNSNPQYEDNQYQSSPAGSPQSRQSQDNYQGQTPANQNVYQGRDYNQSQSYNQNQVTNQGQGSSQTQGVNQGQGFSQNNGVNLGQGLNQGFDQSQGYTQTSAQSQSFTQKVQTSSGSVPLPPKAKPNKKMMALGIIGFIAIIILAVILMTAISDTSSTTSTASDDGSFWDTVDDSQSDSSSDKDSADAKADSATKPAKEETKDTTATSNAKPTATPKVTQPPFGYSNGKYIVEAPIKKYTLSQGNLVNIGIGETVSECMRNHNLVMADELYTREGSLINKQSSEAVLDPHELAAVYLKSGSDKVFTVFYNPDSQFSMGIADCTIVQIKMASYWTNGNGKVATRFNDVSTGGFDMNYISSVDSPITFDYTRSFLDAQLNSADTLEEGTKTLFFHPENSFASIGFAKDENENIFCLMITEPVWEIDY